MADELIKRFSAEVDLIPGSKGIFDVIADGKMIFSKHETGKFPEAGEVSELLEKKMQV